MTTDKMKFSPPNLMTTHDAILTHKAKRTSLKRTYKPHFDHDLFQKEDSP